MDCDPAGRNKARETEGGGGVDPQTLVDNRVEVFELFDLVIRRHSEIFCPEGRV